MTDDNYMMQVEIDGKLVSENLKSDTLEWIYWAMILPLKKIAIMI